MKTNPFRVILCADDGYHLDYLPIASAGWRKFFPEFKISLVVVGDRSWLEYWNFCGRWVDTLHVVRSIPGARAANLAKIARLWICGNFGQDICTIHDIDFTPLQRDFYASKYIQWKFPYVMTMGKEVYYGNTGEEDKIPMSALTAKSFVFQQIANPDNLSFNELYEYYSKPIIGYTRGDIRECCGEGSFSDESLCRAIFDKFGRENLLDIERGYNLWTDTLDRASWKVDRDRLLSGGYLEGHLHKVNTIWERDRCNVVAEYLGVKEHWQTGKHWTDITGQWDQIRVDEADPAPELTMSGRI